jgi:hypothetical protein
MENGLIAEWNRPRFRLVLRSNDASYFGASLRLGQHDPFDDDDGAGIFFDRSFYAVGIRDPALGDSYSESIYRIHLPYHYFVIFFAAFPTLFLAWKLSRLTFVRRTQGGLCTSCGYDLRATPDRCPESGTIATERK